MISGISSGIDYSAITSSAASTSKNSLSYEQQQVIDDTLSNYDSSNLSQSDAQEIVAAFQDANIQPSKQLSDAMSSLGFDAKEVGDLAGVGTDVQNVAQQIGGMPPPPPPPPSNSTDEDEEDDEEYYSTVQSLMDSLFNDDEEESRNSLNTLSDYTSRVLNLNDEAKQNVMDLFDKYNSEDSGYSQDEANTLVKNYLSDMLSDSKNYNHSSFYA
jgi:hypothetical protein